MTLLSTTWSSTWGRPQLRMPQTGSFGLPSCPETDRRTGNLRYIRPHEVRTAHGKALLMAKLEEIDLSPIALIVGLYFIQYSVIWLYFKATG